MEFCARCTVSGDRVRLFDAIFEGRSEKICERCSIIENIPIIKKPTTNQLKESEKNVGVRPRMQRLAGIREFKKVDSYFQGDKLKQLEQNPGLEMPEKEKLNLIDYFHWEIMRNRRRKGLSQKQLAETIYESEMAINMLERGKYPGNAEDIIRKLEQFFQINLRKISDVEKISKRRERDYSKPILLDEMGRELTTIPEPEIVLINEEETEQPLKSAVEISRERLESQMKNNPKRDLNIKEIDSKNVTINDLRNIHKRKFEVTRQEKVEEQRRIEDRNKLVEARKEELRMRKEKESKDLDNVLGGSELLKDDFD